MHRLDKDIESLISPLTRDYETTTQKAHIIISSLKIIKLVVTAK